MALASPASDRSRKQWGGRAYGQFGKSRRIGSRPNASKYIWPRRFRSLIKQKPKTLQDVNRPKEHDGRSLIEHIPRGLQLEELLHLCQETTISFTIKFLFEGQSPLSTSFKNWSHAETKSNLQTRHFQHFDIFASPKQDVRQGLHATHECPEAVQRRRGVRSVRGGPRRVLELQVVGGARYRRMTTLLWQVQAQRVAKPTALPIAGPSHGQKMLIRWYYEFIHRSITFEDMTNHMKNVKLCDCHTFSKSVPNSHEPKNHQNDMYPQVS